MALRVLLLSSKTFGGFGWLLGTFLLAAHLGGGAVLSIPNQSANSGQVLASAVSLSMEGSQVCGVQFDLAWDQGLEVQIATGDRLGASGKQIYSAPLGTRGMRILIVGLNGNPIGDGQLVRLFIVVNSLAASANLTLSNPIGATAAGDPVSVRAASATIRMDPASTGGAILAESVLNAASLSPGPISPGEIVTLLGAFGITGSAPSITATVNRAPATVLYASGNQVNAVMPFGLDPTSPADLELHSPNRQLARITLPTAAASPALFTQDGSGLGPGAILNQDYSPNSAANPAHPGSVVMLYGTAFGPLIPPAGDGQTGVFSTTAFPVSAKIAGAAAGVTYAGAAPGLPAGLVQINVRIPDGVAPGDALAVSLTAGAFAIPGGVTLAVR